MPGGEGGPSAPWRSGANVTLWGELPPPSAVRSAGAVIMGSAWGRHPTIFPAGCTMRYKAGTPHEEVCMALTVKRITLWRAEVEDRPGALGRTLEPLAAAGTDLRLVMGYRFPQTADRSAIEVYPVAGKKAVAAAAQAGLAQSGIPCLLVEGDNRSGFGAALGRALGEAGINVAFLVAQVVGRKFAAVIGFADEQAAGQATKVIRKAAARR